MHHLALQIFALDPVPSDNNVKAGWGAFAIFLLLIAAVALLCWSFVKQLRKVEKANDAGVYDEQQQQHDGADRPPSTHTNTD
jgi:hypothetical protein